MDVIDFHEVVESLKKLIDVYDEEIAPYAVSLCTKLGEAYLRLIAQKESGDEEDNDMLQTEEGLMSTIKRVLKTISGNGEYKHFYSQLEEILEKPIELTFTKAGNS
jgi:hypothetical protein